MTEVGQYYGRAIVLGCLLPRRVQGSYIAPIPLDEFESTSILSLWSCQLAIRASKSDGTYFLDAPRTNK
jgi:hypothetical protein